jgi:molybdopterin/thiamine biosynthesis adenylyltransferase
MEKDIFYKQVKLYNPKEYNPKVYVYGCGSIGSHVIIGLAKIGIKDITVYDYDVVEDGNKPAQFFDMVADGLKTDNCARIVKDFTDTIIVPVKMKIDDEFQPNVEFGSIHIIAFDNIEARKILYNKLRGFPVWIIDGRIGGFQYEIYSFYEDNIKYTKTLEGVFSEQECGMKCLWVVNSMISSKIVTNVIKITKGDIPKYMVIGNILGETQIVGD